MGRPVKQFPKKEVTQIDPNIFIHKSPYTGEFQLWLNVGVQYFSVSVPFEDKRSARHHAKLLQNALDVMVKDRK